MHGFFCVNYLIWNYSFYTVTFAVNFGSRFGGIKMGILFNSGAIPVAVRSLSMPFRQPAEGVRVKLLKVNHCFGSSEWEGFNNALSQKTCHFN